MYGARVMVDLSSTGRMTQLSSTVVPSVSPASGTLISAATAELLAHEHALSLGGAWTDAEVIVEESEDVVVNRLEHAAIDDERRAWRFVLTTAAGDGHREVLIDRITNTVIASIDMVAYFDPEVRVAIIQGEIGGETSYRDAGVGVDAGAPPSGCPANSVWCAAPGFEASCPPPTSVLPDGGSPLESTRTNRSPQSARRFSSSKTTVSTRRSGWTRTTSVSKSGSARRPA